MRALVFGWGTPFGNSGFGHRNTHADYIYNPHPFHISKNFIPCKKNIMPTPKKKKYTGPKLIKSPDVYTGEKYSNLMDEITLTDKNPNIVKFDKPKAMGGIAPMPSGSLKSIISVAKNLPKNIKKGKEFLSAIKKAFKYKYGKTLKTSDIPKDVWTHATSSKEALKTWDKGKEIIGRGEDLSNFTRKIDKGTFTISKANPNSPNFQKGKLFSKGTPEDKSFLVTRKGSQGFIPNLNRVNLSSFKGRGGSSGVGVLKPGSRSTKNLQYYQFDAPKNVYKKINPSKLKKGGSIKLIKKK